MLDVVAGCMPRSPNDKAPGGWPGCWAGSRCAKEVENTTGQGAASAGQSANVRAAARKTIGVLLTRDGKSAISSRSYHTIRSGRGGRLDMKRLLWLLLLTAVVGVFADGRRASCQPGD